MITLRSMMCRILSGRETPDIEERFFYHSFPRRKRNDSSEIDKGCKILTLIRDAGLLLTPEVLEWQYLHADGSPPRVVPVLQKRVCFTELAPRELPRHAAEFGHFALEFKIETLRALGAIPVFYLPTSTTANQESIEGLGSVLAIQLIDARDLANHIAHLSAAVASPEITETHFATRRSNDPSSERKFILAAAEVRRVLEAVTHGLTPAPMLTGGLGGILSLFYPADDVLRNKALHYYRQREWRITGNMAVRGQSVMQGPSADEVGKLQDIDAEFFGRKLKAPWENVELLSECLMYPGPPGKYMIDLVSRVIVPGGSVKKVEAILKDLAHPPPVVSLSSM